MQNKFLVLLFLVLSILTTNKGFGKENNSSKLVVLIAIDGLGSEMINQYESVFKYGFKELRDKGFYFSNASVDHAITVSHAGHVTLSTGRYPSKHGIVDAAFYSTIGNKKALVDAIRDSTEKILGEENGGVSPRKILTPGLAGWIKDNDKNSRILSVGSGYISSLLYCKSSPANVYWYSRSSGRYVTSTYYGNHYPDWLNKFNSENLPKIKEESKTWNCIVPSNQRSLARKDSSNFEADKKYIAFPHLYNKELEEEIKENPELINTWVAWTPFLDYATLGLAEQGIKELALGQRESTDYLSIVLSQVDNICHYYGVYSLEALDMFVRLDKMLGDFFDFLDKEIGRENYVVALSADHGFMDIPEYRVEAGLPGKRIMNEETEALFTDFNNSIKDNPDDLSVIKRSLETLKKKYTFIAETYSPEELQSKDIVGDDEFLRLYKNSYRKDRTPRLPLFSLNTFGTPIGEKGFMVRLKKGTIINLDVNNHGSPYEYDRHVPLCFLGRGVKNGQSLQKVRTVDLAPTLAELANIKYPADVDGKPLIKEESNKDEGQ